MGHFSGQTVRGLAQEGQSKLAYPATQGRPTQLVINVLDQQQYSTYNPR